jgi:UDPglucose 6-dehydrogenase
LSHKITVIGTGYVGLVTGTCLSDFGLEVICVDSDVSKIDKLKKGILPIYEPGLDVLVNKNYVEKRLMFTTDIESSIKCSEVIFIAVGTPPAYNGEANLQYVEEVAKDIARFMNGYKVIVNKSTVPIGTGKLVREIIQKNLTNEYSFDVVSNPEFLREGAAIYDFMHPDRVIVGTESGKAIQIMKNVYRVLFLNQKTPFLFTDIETAETIKYASNAFLAMKVTFINEIAALCEKTGANVVDVARGMGMDGRIGGKFLNPGPGYGGSCLPKDTKALVQIGEHYGIEMSLVKTTIEANERQKQRVVERISSVIPNLQGKTVGILGLAFKPGTDDMRDSPTISIITELSKKGALIKVYDPKAMDEARWKLKNIKNIVFCSNEYIVAEGAIALVILTEWNQFRGLDMAKISNLMSEPRLFDFRNIYQAEFMESFGIEYYCVGRK